MTISLQVDLPVTHYLDISDQPGGGNATYLEVNGGEDVFGEESV